MEKRVEPLMVRTNAGQVEVSQDYETGDESGRVVIPLHQIDLVIKWLKEAKAELSMEQPAKPPKAKLKGV